MDEEYYRHRLWDLQVHQFGAASNVSQLPKALAAAQARYNRTAETPCVGLGFMQLRNRDRALQRCYKPLCPSCWYRKQLEVVEALRRLKPGCTYLRRTWLLPWWEPVHPKLLARWRCVGGPYRNIVTSLNFTAPDRTINKWAHQRDEFGGQLAYQVIGIAQADSPPRERKHVFGPDYIGVYAGDTLAGTIEREEIDYRDAADRWLDELISPWTFRRHRPFRKYLQGFEPGLGRSWTRINHSYLEEKSDEITEDQGHCP